MLTLFGKTIRKLRIDQGEILKDMADYLEVSSAFLSAVENGKKKIPQDWVDKISERYNLDNDKKEELKRAYEITNDEMAKSIKIDFEGTNELKKRTALLFARSFEDINDATAEKIYEMLQKDRERR